MLLELSGGTQSQLPLLDFLMTPTIVLMGESECTSISYGDGSGEGLLETCPVIV
jgi:hypothetical protein